MNREKKKTKVGKIIGYSILSITLIVMLMFSGVLIALNFGGKLDPKYFENKPTDNLSFYDNEDKLLSNKSSNSLATFDEYPKYLIDAFVSIEDKRFYNHKGIDYTRIAGAFVSNLKGNHLQGGSTITQQLIKNTQLNSEKTLKRKFKEAQLAIKLEKTYSKNEILEKYLNILYFGSGEYGVKNACKRFFNKEISQITIAESALLAGIIKSPTKYNPINNYENSITRKNIVIKAMLEQEKITPVDYNFALNEEIVIENKLNENTFDKNYLDNALTQATKILNIDKDDLAYSGYKIFTFLDLAKQSYLKQTIDNKDYSKQNDNNIAPTSAGLLLDNSTRGVSAYYSDKSLDLYNFRRQPASCIKPLVCYTPGLDLGLISPISRILDEKHVFDNNYSPSNYNNSYLGWTSINSCVINSQNVPSVKIIEQIGIDKACNYLKKMDFALDQNDYNLPLALGGMTYGSTFIELASGYSTLANNGIYKQASFIRKIYDNNNNLVWDNDNMQETKVFSANSCALMTGMLINCAKEGTAKKMSVLDFQVASKTGTVSNCDKAYNNDAYNMSYTTENTLLFWQGNTVGEQGKMSSDTTGGGGTTLMAVNYYKAIYKNKAPTDFENLPDIISVKLDKYCYEKDNSLVISSQNAPKYAYIEGKFDKNFAPIERDTSFDIMQIENFIGSSDDKHINLSFDANPRLKYDVYCRNLLDNDKLVETISDKNSKIELIYDISDIKTSAKFTIIPYFFDDENNKILGKPAQLQVNKSNHFFDFLKFLAP